MFQVLAYIAIAVGMSAPSWFVYEIGYLTQEPESDGYICTFYSASTDQSICTKENICAGDSQIASWEIDPNGDKFLHNWVQKLNLTCVDNWKVGLIGASLFLGWSATLLWLPSFADKYGRRRFFWAAMILDLLLFVGLLITTNLIVMICIWFSFGLLCSLRSNVGYVYLMELLPRKA